MKACKKCGEEKLAAEFSTRASAKDGLQSWCRACTSAANRAHAKANPDRAQKRREKWRAENPDHWGDAGRWSHIMRAYGLTKDEYETMLRDQDGNCASCGDLFTETPHVDHSHATKKVRALLCRACNVSFGLLQEDPTRIERLVAYARLHASA